MSEKIFLTATWEYLAMLNYEVDPAILSKHLPPQTEIDLFQGKALVSLVGFLFNNTRVMGIKCPGLTDFEEVNLRYYVRFHDGRTWKRGVGFISEIVPSSLIAFVANQLYNEHYSAARMSHSIKKSDMLEVGYRWKPRNTPWNYMEISAGTDSREIEAGSQEEFIFEHYFGFNRSRSGHTVEYAVEHPRWSVHPVTGYKLSCDIQNAYGPEFVPFLADKDPVSVFLARGSQVLVRRPRIVKNNQR